MMNERIETATLEQLEKEFDAVIGYKSIKKELIRICDIMQNIEFYSKKENVLLLLWK